MSEFFPAKLYAGQPGTSAGVLYTVPAGQLSVLDNVIVCNTTGSAAALTLDVVPAGGSAGVTHRIAAALSVAAGATVSLATSLVALGIAMEEGDTLNGLQGTSGSLTVTACGRTRHN